MKKLLLFLFGLAMYVPGFADGTSTTVYYAVPADVVSTYTVKLNVNFKGDGEDWHDYIMTKSSKTFLGYNIYTCTYVDDWNGVGCMQFQLWNGDSFVSKKEPIGDGDNKTWNWTAVSTYNGKMYVHDKGWATYLTDDANLRVTYHVQVSDSWGYSWIPYKAYEFNGDVNTSWTGSNTTANPWNAGWYDYVVTNPYEFIIFNDNDNNGGNGHQTGDIAIDTNNSEYWYTYTKNSEGNGDTQSIEKPAGWLDDYERTGLTIGNFGTICLPFNATIDGATVFKIKDKVEDGTGNLTGINLESVESLEAGKAYIFKATKTKITATTSGAYTDAIADLGMLGNLSSTPVAVSSENYVLYNNQVCPVGSGVTVGQYKAYITLSGIEPAASRSANFIGFEETTGIESIQSESSNNVVYNLQGQRVTDAQKGLIIVDGKKMLRK